MSVGKKTLRSTSYQAYHFCIHEWPLIVGSHVLVREKRQVVFTTNYDMNAAFYF